MRRLSLGAVDGFYNPPKDGLYNPFYSPLPVADEILFYGIPEFNFESAGLATKECAILYVFIYFIIVSSSLFLAIRFLLLRAISSRIDFNFSF